MIEKRIDGWWTVQEEQNGRLVTLGVYTRELYAVAAKERFEADPALLRRARERARRAP